MKESTIESLPNVEKQTIQKNSPTAHTTKSIK